MLGSTLEPGIFVQNNDLVDLDGFFKDGRGGRFDGTFPKMGAPIIPGGGGGGGGPPPMIPGGGGGGGGGGPPMIPGGGGGGRGGPPMMIAGGGMEGGVCESVDETGERRRAVKDTT
jgi:hypothetical protein